MKRFACHYLVISPTTFLKQYVVEIEGKEVKRYYPFTEEIESTVWLGGTIILSTSENYSFNPEILIEEAIASLTQNVERTLAENGKLFAYHWERLQIVS